MVAIWGPCSRQEFVLESLSPNCWGTWLWGTFLCPNCGPYLCATPCQTSKQFFNGSSRIVWKHLKVNANVYLQLCSLLMVQAVVYILFLTAGSFVTCWSGSWSGQDSGSIQIIGLRHHVNVKSETLMSFDTLPWAIVQQSCVVPFNLTWSTWVTRKVDSEIHWRLVVLCAEKATRKVTRLAWWRWNWLARTFTLITSLQILHCLWWRDANSKKSCWMAFRVVMIDSLQFPHCVRAHFESDVVQ